MLRELLFAFIVVLLAGSVSAVFIDGPDYELFVADAPLHIGLAIQADDFDVDVVVAPDASLAPYVDGERNLHIGKGFSAEVGLLIDPSVPPGLYELKVHAQELGGESLRLADAVTYKIIKKSSGAMVDIGTEMRNPDRIVVIVKNVGGGIFEDVLHFRANDFEDAVFFALAPDETEEFDWHFSPGVYDVAVLAGDVFHKAQYNVHVPTITVVDKTLENTGFRLNLDLDWNRELPSKLLFSDSGVMRALSAVLKPGNNVVDFGLARPVDDSFSTRLAVQTPIRTVHFVVDFAEHDAPSIQSAAVIDIQGPEFWGLQLLAVVAIVLLIFFRNRKKRQVRKRRDILAECDDLLKRYEKMRRR